MPYLNIKWISFFAVSTAVLVTLVSIVGYESYKEGVSSREKGNAYGVDIDSTDSDNFFTNWTASDLALGMVFTVDSFDPSKGSNAVGFHIDYSPINQLTTINETLPAPSVPVRLLLQSATSNFAPNTIMPPTTNTERADGDVNRYPFDIFTVDYVIYGFTSPTNGSYGTPLPLTVFSTGSIQGFKIDTTIVGQEPFDGSGVLVHVVITRSPITQAFSLIVILVMWCLSSGIFIAAMSVYFRERKAELPLIALSTALLFALPNVRNSQPGIPAVAGTISDMVGFFWNLLLVATSAISLLANFIVKNGRGREAAAKAAVKMV
ncbi:hypothetical protein DFH09DRAFT_1374193 [Mycena vulgaris]|nr:hypothetical protein DFH09DRAFT_1374193 [Mycena vulgaris]